MLLYQGSALHALIRPTPLHDASYVPEQYWKIWDLLWGGKGLVWFPVPVWPEMDISTEFPHLLRYHFLLTDYDYRLQKFHHIMVSRPARLLFPVARLPVPAWWHTPSLSSEYPRGRLPGTDSRDHERSTIPVNWDSVTTYGRAISASGGSKGRRRGPTQRSAR